MIAKLSGLPTMPSYMQFTPDGRHFVVALARGFGIRVYKSEDFSLVAEDTKYEDNAIGISFDNQGRMATSAVDGYVRLYDREYRLITKARTGFGERPVATRFSPDGKSLAVGHFDVPAVALLVDVGPLATEATRRERRGGAREPAADRVVARQPGALRLRLLQGLGDPGALRF